MIDKVFLFVSKSIWADYRKVVCQFPLTLCRLTLTNLDSV